MTAKIEPWVKKLAQHVMMVLAHNTPPGPTEYEQALKVISSIIADDIAAHAPKETGIKPDNAQAIRQEPRVLKEGDRGYSDLNHRWPY